MRYRTCSGLGKLVGEPCERSSPKGGAHTTVLHSGGAFRLRLRLRGESLTVRSKKRRPGRTRTGALHSVKKEELTLSFFIVRGPGGALLSIYRETFSENPRKDREELR